VKKIPIEWRISAALLVAGAVIFGRTYGFPFLKYDDPLYVTENPVVRGGLTAEGIRWAFTTTYAAGRHPLTWLSHMTDVSLFGLDAGMHHLVNVFFHLANTLVLFFLLRRISGAVWRSAIVAALFCLHPLHVESVAWVAERRDVLSTLFYFLAIWGYGRYAEARTVGRWLPVFLFTALGLLAKPMVVTLPFVLLLLDLLPLSAQRDGGENGVPAPIRSLSWWGRRVLEKIPLFLLSAVSSLATLDALHRGAAYDPLPFRIRAGTAAVACVTYIGKMFLPVSLSVFYPHPRRFLSMTAAGLSALLLLAITAAAVSQWRRRPWLTFGWLWYVGVLVPVSGLVPAGTHAMADRYTYIPLVGLFLALTWELAGIAEKRNLPVRYRAAFAGAVLAVLSAATWIQLDYWRSPAALFTHALEVTENNWVAHAALGEEALEAGQYADAADHFRATLQIVWNGSARNNLGIALVRLGRPNEAIPLLSDLARDEPMNASARFHLGMALLQKGRFDEAAARFRETLGIDPSYPDAMKDLRLAEAGGHGGGQPTPGMP
jgi:hypothetical protein